MKQLTGQALADAYALTWAEYGTVTATYCGGGWIEISGKLKPTPELVTLYPNGWSMLDRIRSSTARKKLADNNFVDSINRRNIA